ncbi:tripartite tricarboxylate transporter TctB family protein, partial [Leucobacter sp. M11]|nr:tripartite tricarboxylate transporter TctB family protein [Leucobacter sp. M11]
MSAPYSAAPASEDAGAARSGGAPARRLPVGEFVFAGGALLIGVCVLLGAAAIRVPAGSSNVLGPRVFPYAVGALLVAAAVAVLVQVL